MTLPRILRILAVAALCGCVAVVAHAQITAPQMQPATMEAAEAVFRSTPVTVGALADWAWRIIGAVAGGVCAMLAGIGSAIWLAYKTWIKPHVTTVTTDLSSLKVTTAEHAIRIATVQTIVDRVDRSADRRMEVIADVQNKLGRLEPTVEQLRRGVDDALKLAQETRAEASAAGDLATETARQVIGSTSPGFDPAAIAPARKPIAVEDTRGRLDTPRSFTARHSSSRIPTGTTDENAKGKRKA